MASIAEQLAGVAVEGGMAQLGHGPGVDLAEPLPGQAEALANLVQRARLAPVQAKAQPEDLPLPLIERDEHLVDLVTQQGDRRGIERGYRSGVFYHLTQL